MIRRHDAEGPTAGRAARRTRRGATCSTICRRCWPNIAVDRTTLTPTIPLPLHAGAVGYFGYEAGYFVEDMPDLGADDSAMPDVYFMFHDVLLAHCHRTGRSLFVGHRPRRERTPRREAQRRSGCATRCCGGSRRSRPTRPTPSGPAPDPQRAERRRSKSRRTSTRRAIAGWSKQVKEHIFAGDIFEVCLTHRLEAPLVGRRLGSVPGTAADQSGAVCVVLEFSRRAGDFVVAGAVRQPRRPDRVAESRPIKGTRPRGATPRGRPADSAASCSRRCKDRAENVMIVDLVRNDFGRVCKFGTVHVPGADGRRAVRDGVSDGFDHPRRTGRRARRARPGAGFVSRAAR